VFLLEFEKPVAVDVSQAPVLAATGASEEPCLLDYFLVLDFEPALLLSANVVAERPIKVRVFPLQPLES
jgi:hypothetical protein